MVRACAAWGGVRPLFFLGTPGDPDSRCTRGGGLGLAVGWWWGVEAYREQVTCHCGCAVVGIGLLRVGWRSWEA